jgi:hypothetical protein
MVEILSFASTLFPLVFTNNLIMSAVKYLSHKKENKGVLRVILVLVSVAGLITTAALTGDPVDLDKFSSLGMLGVETIILGVASHYSYRVIKEAKPRKSQ